MHQRNNKQKSKSKNIEQSHNLPINETLFLSELIKGNIENSFQINQFSFNDFINKFSTKDIKMHKYYFYFCSISSLNFIIPIQYQSIKTTILYLLLYFIENKLKDELKLLFLFIKKISPPVEELIFLIKMIILLSHINRKDITIRNKDILYNITSKKYINNNFAFDFAIEMICFFDKEELTNYFCSYFSAKILKNKTNKYQIAENTSILPLLYLKSEETIDFLSNAYSLHYNKKFLKFFITDLKNTFFFSNQNIFSHLRKNLNLLSSILLAEEKIYDKDSFILQKGFVMNNSDKNGIKVNSVILGKKFTMIFSFCLTSSEKNKDFPILFFSSSSNNNSSMGFTVKNNLFFFYSLTGMQKEICTIESNLTYIVYFSIEEYNNLILSIKSQNNHWVYKVEYKAKLNKNLNLHIGRMNKINFEGYIGPIMIFKVIFDEDFRKHVFNLMGNYEKLLYLPSYQTAQIDKYEKNNNNLQDDISYNCTNYINSCNYFKQKDFTDNLICYVTPVYTGSKLKKTFYKNNTFKSEIKVIYSTEPKVENGGTFFFEVKNFIYEFLKYEGFNFLILNFELLVANIDQYTTEEDINEIFLFLKALLNFTMDIFFQINIELYFKESQMLLFSIRKSIIKVIIYFLISIYVNDLNSEEN